eukprot:364877-Chlamydomonas_euryale.AAC.10
MKAWRAGGRGGGGGGIGVRGAAQRFGRFGSSGMGLARPVSGLLMLELWRGRGGSASVPREGVTRQLGCRCEGGAPPRTRGPGQAMHCMHAYMHACMWFIRFRVHARSCVHAFVPPVARVWSCSTPAFAPAHAWRSGRAAQLGLQVPHVSARG